MVQVGEDLKRRRPASREIPEGLDEAQFFEDGQPFVDHRAAVTVVLDEVVPGAVELTV